jgi:hypothetical protein
MEKKVEQIINKNILVENNNNSIIIEEYKYYDTLSYYNIYCKNISNSLINESILVYKNEMITTLINYLIMDDNELLNYTGYSTPSRYRKLIIISLKLFMVKMINNNHQENIFEEKIDFDKIQNKNFNLIIDDENININIIIEKKNYNNNSYFDIEYKINNLDKNLNSKLKKVFKGSILDGDIICKNDMTTIMVNYLLVDDNKLSKKIGNFTVQEYKINIMKALNLFWD